MLPAQLKLKHFTGYPPKATQVASSHIELLRQLPLSFVPLLLREVIAYDWKFPTERQEVDSQLAYLGSLSEQQLQQSMAPFERIKPSPELERTDWIKSPGVFSERLSAQLWSTHQINSFRAAAIEFVNAYRAATPQAPPALARLGIVVMGQGLSETRYPLFRKLRRHGAYFTQVSPANGLRILLDAVAARAKAHPIQFAHWYIDGGSPEVGSAPGLTFVSYTSLARVRGAVVAKMRNMFQSGKGTEAVRTALAQMRPEETGLSGEADDAVLNHFEVELVAESSGGQFFTTTFVQWSAREVLRRAQPLTLLARFAPRQTERSMNQMLAGTQKRPELDAEGSLIDADMGAYYTWLNLQRLAGAAESSFLVWFEDHNEALVISRWVPPGSESSRPVNLSQLLDQALGNTEIGRAHV